MTDLSGFQGRTVPVPQAAERIPGPILTETYWGFIVNNTAAVPAWVHVSQGIAIILGAGFAAAALGMWVVPPAGFQMEPVVMRAGASALFAVLGVLLITYGNRGVASELQIDVGLGEVREVLQHRSGRSALIAHYGFDAFTGISIDRTRGHENEFDLILHHQDRSYDLNVATGTQAQIGILFGRLERDLLSGGGRKFEAVTPQPL